MSSCTNIGFPPLSSMSRTTVAGPSGPPRCARVRSRRPRRRAAARPRTPARTAARQRIDRVRCSLARSAAQKERNVVTRRERERHERGSVVEIVGVVDEEQRRPARARRLVAQVRDRSARLLDAGRQHRFVRAERHVERRAAPAHELDAMRRLELGDEGARQRRFPDAGRPDEDESAPGRDVFGSRAGHRCQLYEFPDT